MKPIDDRRRAALCYALLATLCAALFSAWFLVFFNTDWDKLIIYMFGVAGAGIFGYLFWYHVIEKKGRYSLRRSVITGILTVTATHCFSFYGTIIAFNICHLVTGDCQSSLGEPPANPLIGMLIALGYGFLSLLLLFGWVSLPIGIIASIIFYKVRMHRRT